jgi:hypothetical protein
MVVFARSRGSRADFGGGGGDHDGGGADEHDGFEGFAEDEDTMQLRDTT